ncbi:hypothetical protein RB594_002482 [Gaeumannomyces avenae]
MSLFQEDSCSCGQEPITILLLGCTQQGKSSLIRSLYDYAGSDQARDAVQIGVFGNSSVTKECFVYPLTIKLREHTFKDRNGNVLSINSLEDVEDAEALDDGYDTAGSHDGENDTVGDMTPSVKHETVYTGEHLHVRIIDTPGLDDSDNSKAAGDVSTGLHMDVEDEKHKMTIFKAVVAEGKISAVCVVLSTEANLGGALSRILRQYKTLLSHMGVGDNLHFLHTRVDEFNMWDKMNSRPHAVSTALSDFTASHHFINNIPCGPISEYLAQRALARLVHLLAQDDPQHVQQLGYAKPSAFRDMEEHIHDALRVRLEAWQEKIKKKQQEMDELEIDRLGLEARHRKQIEIWHRLNVEYERLDTCDEVEIRHWSGRAGWPFLFVPAWLHVEISTDHPIRKVKRDTPGHAHWEGPGDDHWKNGQRHFSDCLVANGPFSDIWATVWLYGWRKEIEAGRLSTLHAERDHAWAAHASTKDDMDKTSGETGQMRGEKEGLERERDAVASRIAALGQDLIPLDVIQTKGHYLASTSLISYAYGRGVIEDVMELSLLPTHPDPSAKEAALTDYRAKLAQLNEAGEGEESQHKKAGVEASRKAAEAMVNVVLAKNTCRAGLFATLTMSIAKRGHDSPAVWERVFSELKECYLKDPGNWDRLVGLL